MNGKSLEISRSRTHNKKLFLFSVLLFMKARTPLLSFTSSVREELVDPTKSEIICYTLDFRLLSFSRIDFPPFMMFELSAGRKWKAIWILYKTKNYQVKESFIFNNILSLKEIFQAFYLYF